MKERYHFKGFDLVTDTLEVHVHMKTLSKRANKAYQNLRVNVMTGMSALMPVRQGDLRKYVAASNVIMQGTDEMFAAIGSYGRFLYYGKVMVGEETHSPWARKGERKVVTERPLDLKSSNNPNAEPFWFDAAKKKYLDQWVKLVQEDLEGG